MDRYLSKKTETRQRSVQFSPLMLRNAVSRKMELSGGVFFCFGLFVGGVCNDDQRRLLDYVRRDPATSASSLVVVVQAAEE
jgi:hypothetical protein